MKKIAIISPSGNYYGSEQVLHDFLCTSHHQYTVYAPKGKFIDILKADPNADAIVNPIKSIKILYGLLALFLAIGAIDGIYVNEGGHSRYIKLLAKLFPKKKFYIHIRLIEDCTINRIGNMPDNVTLISVSDYITNIIKRNTGQNAITVLDIYSQRKRSGAFKAIDHSNIQLGIVGRLTDTKGVDALISFCETAESKTSKRLTLNFFGDINTESEKVKLFVEKSQNYKNIKCVFHGYVNGSDNIYSHIDILLHFNKIEPLGRIAFESLDYGVPFIGFNAGGIGEIARRTNLIPYMVDPSSNDPSVEFLKLIDLLMSNDDYIEDFKRGQKIITQICSPNEYTSKIETIILGAAGNI